MVNFAQTLLSGLTTGAIYSLIALGFTIVFNGTKVTNFANGEFVMMGGLTTAWLSSVAKLPLIVSLLIAIVVVTALAVALDILCLQRAKRKTILGFAMITIGGSVFYRGVMQTVIGRDVLFPSRFGVLPDLNVGGVSLGSQYLWVLVALVACSAALSLFYLRTRMGKAMRAASQNPQAAALCGIEPRLMSSLAFAMAATTGSLAGALIAPIGGAFYEYGLVFGLKGFAAAVLGGFGSPVGAVIGGLLIGAAESLTAGYISSSWKDAMSLSILLGLLIVWPSGLLGRVEARRV